VKRTAKGRRSEGREEDKFGRALLRSILFPAFICVHLRFNIFLHDSSAHDRKAAGIGAGAFAEPCDGQHEAWEEQAPEGAGEDP
jgi:hypothetical protein